MVLVLNDTFNAIFSYFVVVCFIVKGKITHMSPLTDKLQYLGENE
jgi:hypothetical protein